MKIRHIDYSSLIVEITKREFEIITGIRLGDQHYDCDLRYDDKLIGKNFDLPNYIADNLHGGPVNCA